MFVSLCVCAVHLSIILCVFPVAFVLSAFVMYLVWIRCKRIRVIHCFYVLKNHCKKEKRLLGIISLESQTSFSCN